MKKLLTIAFAFGLFYFLPQQIHANFTQEQQEEVEVVEMPVEEVQEEPEMTVAEAPSVGFCLLYTSPSPRDMWTSRMPSSA